MASRRSIRLPMWMQVLGEAWNGTLIVVNSVCGCAAGGARPGVTQALQAAVIPDHLTTVFAGVDMEATQRARERMPEVAPSSPSVALFKDGALVYALERRHIERMTPDDDSQRTGECLSSALHPQGAVRARRCVRAGSARAAVWIADPEL